MRPTKAIVGSAIVAGVLVFGPAVAAFACHADLQESATACDATSGTYTKSATLTNPNEPDWNHPTMRLIIDNSDGWSFNSTTLKPGDQAKATARVAGTTTGSLPTGVTFHWVDLATGQIIQPGSSAHAELSSPLKGDCTPPPAKTDITFTASVECRPVSGTSTFILHVNQTSGPKATFSPKDGDTLALGAPFVVKGTWDDPYYGTQTKTVTTKPVANCVTLPPTKPNPPSQISTGVQITATPVKPAAPSITTHACSANSTWNAQTHQCEMPFTGTKKFFGVNTENLVGLAIVGILLGIILICAKDLFWPKPASVKM